ncbi:MAG TPA: 4Fe-4S dicluster domain-containing protein, partial [Actinobacteria bacterium]|nr:4Fe-4S dicluster domain-containing protein [Actinomycetes bacterium]HEX21447.1 4Fe-4S dicluster domain-containing protein [Actinomycetota bacterium]
MKNWNYKEHPAAAVIPTGGTSNDYETGGWRSERPVWHEDKCTHCMICWVFCPDSSIKVSERKMYAIDYDHCKGCGICAQECPKNAID